MIAGEGDLQLLMRGELQCRSALPVAVLVWGPWPASLGAGMHAACQVGNAGLPPLLLEPHGVTARCSGGWLQRA